MLELLPVNRGVEMFIRLRSDIMYRDYGSFGYITDNRNYEYRLLNDQHDDLGEIVVSKSGMVFLKTLLSSLTI